MSFSRARCYDVYSFQDPIIQDMPLTDIDQLDCGFNVVDISKGEKVFLQRGDDPTSEEGFKVVFPHADVQSSSLIVYGVTYRSKFSLGIFPIEKLIFVSEIN